MIPDAYYCFNQQSVCGADVLRKFPFDYCPQIFNSVKVWWISRPIQHIYSWLRKEILHFLRTLVRCDILLKNWTFWRAAVSQPGYQIFSQNVLIFIRIHHAFDRDQSARSWSRRKTQNTFFGGCVALCWICAVLIGLPILLRYRGR